MRGAYRFRYRERVERIIDTDEQTVTFNLYVGDSILYVEGIGMSAGEQLTYMIHKEQAALGYDVKKYGAPQDIRVHGLYVNWWCSLTGVANA